MMLTSPRVTGLSAAHQDILDGLIQRIGRKAARNRLRRSYYDYKSVLKDLGIAIPPSMRSVDTVLGWAAKGVDGLTRRTVLDGFTLLEGSTADIGLDLIWDANRMDSETPMAHTSAAVQAVAFAFVTAGDVASGEPQSLITTRSAEWATGEWDSRRRGLKSALSVMAADDSGTPSEMVLYLPGLAVIMRREGRRWDIRQSVHDLGMPVEPLVYRPALDRPFGSSRISRPVMALTDAAVRTLVRSEVSAEFFSAPQRYLLGADEEAFVDEDGNPVPAWQSIIGRILAIGRDEHGDLPTVGQFAQHSMEPHFAQVRQLASLFAAEMNMTPRSFGIMQDNPESAEAITAAREDLVIEARHWQLSLGPAWKRIAVAALRLQDDSPAARQVYAGLRPHWMNASTPSVVSASDAFSKQIASMPELIESGVGYEMLGYDEGQVLRLEAARRRASGRALLQAVTGDDAS